MKMQHREPQRQHPRNIQPTPSGSDDFHNFDFHTLHGMTTRGNAGVEVIDLTEAPSQEAARGPRTRAQDACGEHRSPPKATWKGWSSIERRRLPWQQNEATQIDNEVTVTRPQPNPATEGGALYPSSARDSPQDAASLRFAIPPTLLREAHANSAKWTHLLYRAVENPRQSVRVSCATTLAESEALAQAFAEESVLGFDMEWKPKGGSSSYIGNNISLIQIANEHHIGLFHIARHPGSSVQDVLAPTLQRIIEDGNIVKCGVAIEKADGARLKRFMKLQPAGMLELSYLHHLVAQLRNGGDEHQVARKSFVSLKFLVQYHLGGLELAKGPVRCSDWTKSLTANQIKYAAADAYAGYMIYRALEAKRQRLRMPTIPQLQTVAASENADSSVAAQEIGIADLPPDSLGGILQPLSASSINSMPLEQRGSVPPSKSACATIQTQTTPTTSFAKDDEGTIRVVFSALRALRTQVALRINSSLASEASRLISDDALELLAVKQPCSWAALAALQNDEALAFAYLVKCKSSQNLDICRFIKTRVSRENT